MCTLTYFPDGRNKFILTSNRDEAPNRPTLPLSEYQHGDSSFLYPKDGVAGGSWIAAGSNRRIVSLLNGGFKPHKPDGPYRMSRGVVVLEVLTTSDLKSSIHEFDLNGVEPFTLVVVDWNEEIKIMDLVWDGEQRHINVYENEPLIWSSSLLYSEEMKQQRRVWFEDFKNEMKLTSDKAILDFHHNAGKGNDTFALVMDRGYVKTKSISQIKVSDSLIFDYEELGNKRTRKELSFNS